MNEWRNALATHEEAQKLASGEWLGVGFPGVALPSRRSLHRWVLLRYGAKITCAQIEDVGPWCVDDDNYVFGGEKPRAEIFIGKRCPYRFGDLATMATVPDGKGGWLPAPISNGAGIDIFPRTAKELGIPIGENVRVDWRWIEF